MFTSVQWAISSCRGIQCVLTGVGLPASSAGETTKGEGSGRSVWSVTVLVWGSKHIELLLFYQTWLELTALHEARGLSGREQTLLNHPCDRCDGLAIFVTGT